MMHNIWDVIIVGAGPAGMSAAIETSQNGLSTLVLDRQAEPGGQIYRNVNKSPLVKKLGRDYAEGLPLVQKFLHSKARFEGGANVWDIAPDRVYYSQNGESSFVNARQVILASGAMERPVPLPGWTLPGVMGVGASDVVLKSASMQPNGKVVICGNGPLVLQAAVHMLMFKIPVVAVLFTGRPSNLLRSIKYLAGGFSRPAYFLQGFGMALNTLLRHKCFMNVHNVHIDKTDGKLEVNFDSLSGSHRTLDADTVLLHEGVVPESRITRLARCRHAWEPKQLYWHVEADLWGKTSISGLRTAGDAVLVRGAAAAQAEGHLVGLDTCRELGKLTLSERDKKASPYLRTIKRCQSMQRFLDEYFAPTPSILHPAADTIVCRCEELTAGMLYDAIKDGSYSPNGLKAQVRPGMGTCQGRFCGPAVAEMIANVHGLPLERLPLYTAQIPLFPLGMQELIDMPSPAEQL